MSKKNTYTVHFRRKREGKTHYQKRLKLLLSQKPRLVVRKSLSSFSAQIINYDKVGDITVAYASSSHLVKLGWLYGGKNAPSAYLVGYLLAKKAAGKGVSEAILDIGLYPPLKGSNIYAVLQGAVDGGLHVAHGEDIVLIPERITGAHITKYAAHLKKNKEQYERQFSGYLRKGADPGKLPEAFAEFKEKLGKS